MNRMCSIAGFLTIAEESLDDVPTLESQKAANRGLVEMDDEPTEIPANKYINLNKVTSARRIGDIREPFDNDVFVFSTVEGQDTTIQAASLHWLLTSN